jgi:hypothetical protein
MVDQIFDLAGNFSSTFYPRLFGMEVLCAGFLSLKFGFVIFLATENCRNAASKMLMKLTTGINFTQHFTCSCYAHRSQKCKNTVKLSVFFCAFEICVCKNCSKNVDEIDFRPEIFPQQTVLASVGYTLSLLFGMMTPIANPVFYGVLNDPFKEVVRKKCPWLFVKVSSIRTILNLPRHSLSLGIQVLISTTFVKQLFV